MSSSTSPPHSGAALLAQLEPAQAGEALRLLARIVAAYRPSRGEHEFIESERRDLISFLGKHFPYAGRDIDLRLYGSALMGTSVRDDATESFNVDFALRLPKAYRYHEGAALLESLHDMLATYAASKALVLSLGLQSVGLTQPRAMHFDLMPLIAQPATFIPYGEDLGRAPDRKHGRYALVNPRGFAQWFADISLRIPTFALSGLPQDPISALLIQRPLPRIVQLFKIHRNAHFADRPHLAPGSCFLTALIGKAYVQSIGRQFDSPLNLLFEVWRSMLAFIERTKLPEGQEHWSMRNVITPQNNLAAPMNDYPKRQAAFDTWHAAFADDVETFFEALIRGHVPRAALAEFARRRFGARTHGAVMGDGE